MLTIRDIREEDREIFFKMEKEFYGGEACIRTVPQEHFEATLQECLRSREHARVLMLEDESGVVGYLLLAFTFSNEAGGLTDGWKSCILWRTPEEKDTAVRSLPGWSRNMPMQRDSAWKPHTAIKERSRCMRGWDMKSCIIFR